MSRCPFPKNLTPASALCVLLTPLPNYLPPLSPTIRRHCRRTAADEPVSSGVQLSRMQNAGDSALDPSGDENRYIHSGILHLPGGIRRTMGEIWQLDHRCQQSRCRKRFFCGSKCTKLDFFAARGFILHFTMRACDAAEVPGWF